jgi:ribose transport system permease protein
MNMVVPQSTLEGGADRRVQRQRYGSIIAQFGMVWAFIILVVAGSIVYPRLISVTNIINIFSQNAPIGIVAVGMTFVMIGGGFDLSVGAVFALGACVFADMTDLVGVWGAALVVILVSAVCGTINGFIVTKLKVNPFVATLGSGSAFGGIAYIYSHSAPITPNDPTFQTLGTGTWIGIPISIWLMALIIAIGGFTLAKSVYGQSIYAIGGNNEAARLSGLRVNLLRASTYVLTAVCAGLGGMIIASRLGVGQADMGTAVALDTIAVVVIGGTSLLGGEGAMWRTVIGLLVLAVLANIFDSLAIATNYQLLVKGTIIVGSVALDTFARSLRT